jgi:hypothetical protein
MDQGFTRHNSPEWSALNGARFEAALTGAPGRTASDITGTPRQPIQASTGACAEPK